MPGFQRLNKWREKIKSVFAFCNCGVFEEADGDGDESEEVDEYEEAASAKKDGKGVCSITKCDFEVGSSILSDEIGNLRK